MALARSSINRIVTIVAASAGICFIFFIGTFREAQEDIPTPLVFSDHIIVDDDTAGSIVLLHYIISSLPPRVRLECPVMCIEFFDYTDENQWNRADAVVFHIKRSYRKKGLTNNCITLSIQQWKSKWMV